MDQTGKSAFYKFLYRHWPLTFVVMTVAFLVFGWLSLHLVEYASANLSLIHEHGLQALQDGALQQFLELALKAMCTVFFYLIFKATESILVQRLFTASKETT